jgi:hypothetical protein
MRSVFALILWFSAGVTHAVEPGASMVNGGRSPNGRYEVRLATVVDGDPADFLVRIFDRHSGGYLEQDGVLAGTDRRWEALRSSYAVWSEDGRWVALADLQLPASQELAVFEIRAEGARLLKIPDLVGAAFGVEPSTSGSWVWPLQWIGRRLLVKVELGTGAGLKRRDLQIDFGEGNVRVR